MASLEGAKVVVAGGAGGVGEGIVRSLLRRGARVLVPSRSRERLRALESYCKDIQAGEPLTSVDMPTWHRILRENLTAHFLALKMLVPLLHPKTGSYVHINAFSAEQPYPMAGPVAMAGAAQKSMVLTLAQELRPTGIRVYEMILGPIRT